MCKLLMRETVDAVTQLVVDEGPKDEMVSIFPPMHARARSTRKMLGVAVALLRNLSLVFL